MNIPYEQAMLSKNDNGEYYFFTHCGYKIITPTETREIIKGLQLFCDTHTDKEIELGNKLAMKEMFER